MNSALDINWSKVSYPTELESVVRDCTAGNGVLFYGDFNSQNYNLESYINIITLLASSIDT